MAAEKIQWICYNQFNKKIELKLRKQFLLILKQMFTGDDQSELQRGKIVHDYEKPNVEKKKRLIVFIEENCQSSSARKSIIQKLRKKKQRRKNIAYGTSYVALAKQIEQHHLTIGPSGSTDMQMRRG